MVEASSDDTWRFFDHLFCHANSGRILGRYAGRILDRCCAVGVLVCLFSACGDIDASVFCKTEGLN